MVLVTGGTGFLGAYILRELINKGFRVRAIRRSSKLPAFMDPAVLEKVEWVDGDVLDVVSLADAMQGVSQVIHSAAVVSFLKKERRQMYQVNVDGTANVMNAALENQISRFVHISSVAALGRMAGGGHVDEEKKWEDGGNNTHYGRSKFKAELEIWRGMGEGMNAVILNPSTVLGFGDWNSGSCAIFKNIYKGFRWYTPGINGFVDVEDVARVAVLMLENDILSQRFIVNAENWTFRRLQETIADGLKKKRPVKKATPFLISLAWRFERLKSLFSGQKPLLTRESAKVACSQTYFENQKILDALPGFSFTPLEETIKKACEKYGNPAR